MKLYNTIIIIIIAGFYCKVRLYNYNNEKTEKLFDNNNSAHKLLLNQRILFFIKHESLVFFIVLPVKGLLDLFQQALGGEEVNAGVSHGLPCLQSTGMQFWMIRHTHKSLGVVYFPTRPHPKARVEGGDQAGYPYHVCRAIHFCHIGK